MDRLPTLIPSMCIDVCSVDNGWLVKINAGGPSHTDPLGQRTLKQLMFCRNPEEILEAISAAMAMIETEETT